MNNGVVNFRPVHIVFGHFAVLVDKLPLLLLLWPLKSSSVRVLLWESQGWFDMLPCRESRRSTWTLFDGRLLLFWSDGHEIWWVGVGTTLRQLSLILNARFCWGETRGTGLFIVVNRGPRSKSRLIKMTFRWHYSLRGLLGFLLECLDAMVSCLSRDISSLD